MKNHNQRSCTRFLRKYGVISLYDVGLKKRYNIDHEGILFVKRRGYYLIVNPDHTYGTSTDHEYFFIRDDFFDQILATNQNDNISLKIVPKNVSLP